MHEGPDVSVWAVTGQLLGLIVGGAGLGLGMAFGGMIYFERDRAARFQDQYFSERIDHLDTAAALGTCVATRDALREGKEINDAIPDDLGGFVLPDAWRLQPGPPAD
jgi:hypothetical protein